ncbi:MAG: glycosyltransferase family 39 protein [Leptolyngbyaceae cyanobacterium MO_188.B28]|nr:glycosyltransferase family 39 protein [Leptolyngbyaceae cyanobacterium MO_188.B28]
MALILPLAAFLLLFRICHRRDTDWRAAVLLAAIAWGVWVVLTTEVLSLFHWLAWGGLVLSWGLFDVGLIVYSLRAPQPAASPKQTETGIKLTPFLTLLLAGVIGIIAVIGVIALIAPPNNLDSMTYHMGRVVHWIQNRSVAHYPTGIIRQLYSGPFGGFAITHLQILSGGDRFANLIQWFSMVGSIIGVSLLAEQLGADKRGQIFASVVCAAIPMGILQSSSTQTDYVVSFWVVCFAYLVLRTIQDKMSFTHTPALGASLGLAVLAKGTAYLYAFPFGVWLVLTGVKRLGWKLWKTLLLMGTIALSLNIGYYLRNYVLFGSFLGKSGQGMEAFGVSIFISNFIRNIVLHLSTPVRSVNLKIIGVVNFLHKLIGVDPSDPRITSPAGQNFDIHSLINHEDLAGNPVHLLLIVLSVICFIAIRKTLRNRQQFFIAAYFLATFVGFLLFCLLIIWSPWRSRLHLPVFVLASAFIGVVLTHFFKTKVANALALGLIGLSFIWVCFNETRPLILNSQIVEAGRIENIFNQTRSELYFASDPELGPFYVDAAKFIKSNTCPNIGLSFGGNTWEYPLWALLKNQAHPTIRLEHVNVDNESSEKYQSKPFQDFIPCMLVASGVETAKDEELVALNQVYVREWSEGPISIFLNQPVSNINP